MANEKLLSQASGRNSVPEVFDFEGRIVIATTKRIASKIGLVRGLSSDNSVSFVEPNRNIKLGDELLRIREDIAIAEREISNHLSASILQKASCIDQGLDKIARIDSIFARAAFGCTMDGCVPDVGSEGVIDVADFVHPVLSVSLGSGSSSSSVVPIDLKVLPSERSLLISGPNGGGKTIAMKSFGLVAMMNKLGIPIPINKCTKQRSRVDFFHEIFVELGDNQDIIDGESTYTVRMNALSALLNKLSSPDEDDSIHIMKYSLILLDELGSGTETNSGSCIAQAILENILDIQRTRLIATTHSTRLKALSINDARFNCASVLLEPGNAHSPKRPGYELCYGVIGDSHALAAASRSTPPFPSDLLERAADLMAGEDNRGDIARAITSSLETERKVVLDAKKNVEETENEIIMVRGAMISLAKAYDQKLSRIETHFDDMIHKLNEDESKSNYDVVGDTLGSLRLVMKKIKSEEEILREKGLIMVSDSYEFRDGETVVIIAEGEWKGETGCIASNHSDIESKLVTVIVDSKWYGLTSDPLLPPIESSPTQPIEFKRNDLAIFDYPSEDTWKNDQVDKMEARSVSDGRIRLNRVLTTLKTSAKGRTSGSTSVKKNDTPKVFTSSRERKAAAKRRKKGKK